jgi:cbb3-type cytochrome oxidase subunit 3
MKGISTLKKIITCIIAGLVSSFCFFRIGKRFLVDWLNFRAVFIIGVIILLTAITYAIYWAARKNRANNSSSDILAFWQGVIRYSIALDLTMIGFQKFFRLQFSTPLGRLDLPFSTFTSEELTWAYFGHSRVFACIIGGFQILGSFLLLFSKTRLVGTFVLIPVMLNIILLNACYHMEWGESIQAIELLIALLYLLLCDYHRLVEFFFRSGSDLPSMRHRSVLFKALMRFSILFIPLFLIWNYGSPDKNPWLTGKYQVIHLMVNHQNIKVNSCSDSVLSVVYLDQGNDCVFEYNSQQRRLYGLYQLDQTNTRMTVIWHYPRNIHDTMTATISAENKDHKLLISGKMGTDTIEVELLKMR